MKINKKYTYIFVWSCWIHSRLQIFNFMCSFWDMTDLVALFWYLGVLYPIMHILCGIAHYACIIKINNLRKIWCARIGDRYWEAITVFHKLPQYCSVCYIFVHVYFFSLYTNQINSFTMSLCTRTIYHCFLTVHFLEENRHVAINERTQWHAFGVVPYISLSQQLHQGYHVVYLPFPLYVHFSVIPLH